MNLSSMRQLVRRSLPIAPFLALLTLSGCSTSRPALPETQKGLQWTDQVGAKRFPDGKAVFKVNDFSARNDGTTLSTTAIQEAINACAMAGGGVVSFAPGAYLTGSLFVKSGVNLHLDRGVELRGSQDIADYPEIDTRVAGIEMKWPAALLNVLDQHTAAITGEGTVNARGKPFWDHYWAMRRDYEAKGLRWIVDYDAKRPRTVLVSNSRDVTVQGITLMQAGFWTVHVLYSRNVTCDGLIIRNNVGGHGPSTDGIDIDSSSYVLVEHCDIDCNDDNFCFKAGRDWDGLRVNRPTEYVVIRNCLSRAGGGLITFGSETSGGFRHILAQHLQAKGTGVGLRFKSARTRGGTIEDIHLEDIQMDGVGTALEVSMNWNPSYSYSTLPEGYSIDSVPPHWRTMLHPVEPPDRGIPHFQDVHIRGVRATNCRTAINVSGTAESIVRDFTLEDVNIQAQRAGRIAHASGWRFKNVILNTADHRPLQIQDCVDMDGALGASAE